MPRPRARPKRYNAAPGTPGGVAGIAAIRKLTCGLGSWRAQEYTPNRCNDAEPDLNMVGWTFRVLRGILGGRPALLRKKKRPFERWTRCARSESAASPMRQR